MIEKRTQHAQDALRASAVELCELIGCQKAMAGNVGKERQIPSGQLHPFGCARALKQSCSEFRQHRRVHIYIVQAAAMCALCLSTPSAPADFAAGASLSMVSIANGDGRLAAIDR